MGSLRRDIIDRFSQLNVWRRGDERAPHKPLLILLALGRIEQGSARLVEFEEVAPQLTRLLLDFGPPRKSHHPEYPFWRLQNDEVWEVRATEEIDYHVDPSRGNLIKAGAVGGFLPEVHEELAEDLGLRHEIAHHLLESHFPESYWEDLLNAVGLSALNTASRRPRDPAFRDAVLTAYAYSCSFCGMDLRIGETTLGLEAAHIKWKQAGGPDLVRNGLCLCSFHHKAFDLGAIGLDGDFRIRVSAHLHGSDRHRKVFLQIHGLKFRPPSRAEWQPGEDFRRWHLREVFRPPAVEGEAR